MTDRKNQLRIEIMNRLLDAIEGLGAARNRQGDRNYEVLSIDPIEVLRKSSKVG